MSLLATSRTILSAGAVTLLCFGCTATSGRLDGFRSLSDTAHGYALVTSPVRAGALAQRFEVRPGDCGADRDWSDCANDRERSEISVRNRILPGTVTWVAFSLHLPADFATSGRVATTLGQIHQQGGPSGRAGGLASFPPLLQFEAKGNSYGLALHRLTGEAGDVRDETDYFPLAAISSMRGKWTDLLVMLDSRDGGVLEVYVDGRKAVATSNFIRFTPRHYYLKYGVYRSFVSRHGGPMPTQVAVFDEVRIGDSREAVEVGRRPPVD